MLLLKTTSFTWELTQEVSGISNRNLKFVLGVVLKDSVYKNDCLSLTKSGSLFLPAVLV